MADVVVNAADALLEQIAEDGVSSAVLRDVRVVIKKRAALLLRASQG
jgi:hypothetical protein